MKNFIFFIMLEVLSSKAFSQTESYSRTKCFGLNSDEFIAMQTVISREYKYHSLSRLDNINYTLAFFPWSRKDQNGVIKTKTKNGTIYQLKLDKDNVPIALGVYSLNKKPISKGIRKMTYSARKCNQNKI